MARRWLIPPILAALLVLHSGAGLAQSAAGEASTASATPDAEPTGASVAPRGTPAGKVILLVRTRDDEAVITQLEAELQASAWELVEIRLDSRFGQRPLSELAARNNASAALRVHAERSEIEVWTAAPVGDEPTSAASETLRVDEDSSDGRVMALRATEALRARGLDLTPLSKPDSDEPSASSPRILGDDVELQPVSATDLTGAPFAPPTADEPERNASGEPPGPGRVWLEAGPGAMLSPGGVGPLWGVTAGIRADIASGLSLGASGFAPLNGPEVSADEGSATIATWLLGVVVDTRLHSASSWNADAGVGLSWARTRMDGNATQGYVADSEEVHAVAPSARGAVHFKLADSLLLVGRLTLGATFPRFSVEFAEREVAHFGRPFVTAMLGLEVPIALNRR